MSPSIQVFEPSGADRRPCEGSSTEDFDVFYRREFRGVVALAYSLCGSSRHAAEDLAQDGFIAAHRRWDEISSYDQPLAWVRRVVVNMSVSAGRRRMSEAKALTRIAGRRQTVVEAFPDGDADFASVVRSLPPRQRQAVALHYLFDLPVVDVAATLEISDGAVKAHLHKARARLAESLRAGAAIVD